MPAGYRRGIDSGPVFPESSDSKAETREAKAVLGLWGRGIWRNNS
jgi:hypothetical protein